MGRGRFEEDLSQKFNRKSVKPPSKVWESIESDLNKGLLASYLTSNKRYKWAAVASIFIASLSFAYQFVDLGGFITNHQADGHYNALLSYGYTSEVPPQQRWLTRSPPIFRPIIVERGKPDTTNSYLAAESEESTDYQIKPEINFLSPKRYKPKEIEFEEEIYPYLQAPSYRPLSRVVKRERNTLWAGLEAGAGNFNAISSGSLSSSVDAVSLASAVNNDGFINPSTEVNPNLNSGIATSIGLDFGMNLGKKWTLETGLSYTAVASNGDALINILDTYILGSYETLPSEEDGAVLPSSSRETEVIVEENYDYSVEVTSSAQFTTVPLKAGYFLMDRRMSLRLSLGIAANYLLTSDLNGEDGIIQDADYSLNKWSLDGLGGFEIGYAMSNSFDFVLEPNYFYALTPMNIGSGTNNSRFIVQTGLKYTLR